MNPEPRAESDRLTYWRRRLAPLRVGAEPIEAQLGRRFLALVLITAVFTGVGLMILAIFSAFGRVDVGLKVAGLIAVAPTAWSWLDHVLLRRRVAAYLRERPGGETPTTPPPG